jgi:hypothetical protein
MRAEVAVCRNSDGRERPSNDKAHAANCSAIACPLGGVFSFAIGASEDRLWAEAVT